MIIRKALVTDLPAIVAIYNQAINSRCCTGDTKCFDVHTRLPWFESHDNPKTPVFVCDTGHEILAYSSISLYRPGRQAFGSVGEISYYVDFNHHKKGIGTQLLEHLIDEAKKIGYTHLIAILLDCNLKSIALLKKFGFGCWGTMPEIAHIDDMFYSHLYYGIRLEGLDSTYS